MKRFLRWLWTPRLPREEKMRQQRRWLLNLTMSLQEFALCAMAKEYNPVTILCKEITRGAQFSHDATYAYQKKPKDGIAINNATSLYNFRYIRP